MLINFFAQGYVNSGNQDFMLDNLRWIADYFVKCHHSPQAFTAQVGSTNADHAVWGRAEDMTMARPAYDLTPSAPGENCGNIVLVWGQPQNTLIADASLSI